MIVGVVFAIGKIRSDSKTKKRHLLGRILSESGCRVEKGRRKEEGMKRTRRRIGEKIGVMKTQKVLRKLSFGAGMECERRGRETDFLR